MQRYAKSLNYYMHYLMTWKHNSTKFVRIFSEKVCQRWSVLHEKLYRGLFDSRHCICRLWSGVLIKERSRGVNPNSFRGTMEGPRARRRGVKLRSSEGEETGEGAFWGGCGLRLPNVPIVGDRGYASRLFKFYVQICTYCCFLRRLQFFGRDVFTGGNRPLLYPHSGLNKALL